MTEDRHEAPFMTRGAAYATMIMGVFMIGIAAFNVTLWNDSRAAKADLKAERAARLSQRQQDERAAKIQRVTQCRQSIPAIHRANIVISDIRDDHLDRAQQARDLAEADPTQDLRDVHLKIARQQAKKARDLKGFPPVTKKQCNELAAKLFGHRWRTIIPPPTTTTTPGR